MRAVLSCKAAWEPFGATMKKFALWCAHGHSWALMGTHRHPWVPVNFLLMDAHGCLLALPMGVSHGLPWEGSLLVPMSAYGFPCPCPRYTMVTQKQRCERSWVPTGLDRGAYGIPWVCMCADSTTSAKIYPILGFYVYPIPYAYLNQFRLAKKIIFLCRLLAHLYCVFLSTWWKWKLRCST